MESMLKIILVAVAEFQKRCIVVEGEGEGTGALAVALDKMKSFKRQFQQPILQR